MNIILRAGGIIRSGPERDLINEYLKRANGLARGTGFLSVEEQQVDLRGAKTRAHETRLLTCNLQTSSKIIIFDERDGIAQLFLIIGGADGFEAAELPKGLTRWAFGPQTWPHKMVRVMACEQIYRALSIIAGTPYHRD